MRPGDTVRLTLTSICTLRSAQVNSGHLLLPVDVDVITDSEVGLIIAIGRQFMVRWSPNVFDVLCLYSGRIGWIPSKFLTVQER